MLFGLFSSFSGHSAFDDILEVMDSLAEQVGHEILPENVQWFKGTERHLKPVQYEFDDEDDLFNDSMDGDHASAMASAGWGTDEDYGAEDLTI